MNTADEAKEGCAARMATMVRQMASVAVVLAHLHASGVAVMPGLIDIELGAWGDAARERT